VHRVCRQIDRRDDLDASEIPAGSSDAPEAGGLKL
jgi:hypothetical protein